MNVNFAFFCEFTRLLVVLVDTTTSPITMPMTTGTISVAIQKRRFVSVRITSNETMVPRLCRAIGYTSASSF